MDWRDCHGSYDIVSVTAAVVKEIGGASAAPSFRWGLAIAAVLATLIKGVKMRALFAVCIVAFVAGCSGKMDYVRPSASPVASNSKTIAKPRDIVWNASIPELSKQFFVINNMDKSSGLINMSYT